MKKMVSFLLAVSLIIDGGKCLALETNDPENPDFTGEVLVEENENTDLIDNFELDVNELDKEKSSFSESLKSGLKCVGGLIIFAGMVIGGGYLFGFLGKSNDNSEKDISINPEEDSKELLESSEVKIQSQNLNLMSTDVVVDGITYSSDKKILIKCSESKAGKVIIPDSVEEIADEAFYECSLVTDVIMSDNVIDIGDYVFVDCLALKNIRFSDNIKYIPAYTFYSCSGLTELELPRNIVRVYEFAFEKCSNLNKIIIPSNIQTINVDAFENSSPSLVLIFRDCSNPINKVYYINYYTKEGEIPYQCVPEPTRSATPRPTRSATFQATPKKTLNPTRTATFQATPKKTLNPTRTATFQATPKKTLDPTRTATFQATPKKTLNPTRTATFQATPLASLEPTRPANLRTKCLDFFYKFDRRAAAWLML